MIFCFPKNALRKLQTNSVSVGGTLSNESDITETSKTKLKTTSWWVY